MKKRAGKLLSLLAVSVILLTGCDFSVDLPKGDGKNIYTEEKSDSTSSNSGIVEDDGLELAFSKLYFGNSAGGQVVVRYRNSNAWAVKVTSDFCFFSESGSVTDVQCRTIPCLQPGETYFEVFESDSGYANYACDYTMGRALDYSIETLKNIKVETSNPEEGGPAFTVTNTGRRSTDVVLTIFYFDASSNVIGYDRQKVTVGGGQQAGGCFALPESGSYAVYAVYRKLQ